MLSDAERHRLAEIESVLRAEDPKFVQRFYSRRRSRRWVAAVSVGFIAAVMATVIALAVGSVLGVVVGLVAVGTTIGMWASRPDR
jgi:hypothetical protein